MENGPKKFYGYNVDGKRRRRGKVERKNSSRRSAQKERRNQINK